MLYRLVKLSYLVFIFYMVWYQSAFSPINRAPLILGSSMMLLLILYKMSRRGKISFSLADPIIIWIVFAIFALFSGYIVAANRDVLLNSITTYAQIIILMVFIVDFSRYEGNANFFLKSYAFLSIVYSLYMLFFGYRFLGRVTLSASSNPNGDGLTLIYGIFCILTLSEGSKRKMTFFVSQALIGLLLYSIVLTGSRKSFLAAVALVFLWFILVFPRRFRASELKWKLVYSAWILSIVLLGAALFLPIFLHSVLFFRLTEELGAQSDQVRISMYQMSAEFFASSPLVGIGFNQFRVLSPWRTYSHSTYAEIISSTGIIGTILYFIPYCWIIYKLIYVYLLRRKSEVGTQALMYLVLMIVMLLLGAGVIHFYSITDNIMFALMISFCAQSLTDIKKERAQVSRKREEPRLGLY